MHPPTQPVCAECGQPYWPPPIGPKHECDVDTKFIHQERIRREAELAVEIAKADEEMGEDRIGLTLARWQLNATCTPCPDADHANVSLPRRREFADWQRQHETETP